MVTLRFPYIIKTKINNNNSKAWEKIIFKTLDITRVSLGKFKDLITLFLQITLTDSCVACWKKLNIIIPKRRYRGYFGIPFPSLSSKINNKRRNVSKGFSKYHKIPR